MILIKIDENSRVEVITKEELVIHFGRISISMSSEEFMTFTSMFDASSGDEMPNDKICSVHTTKKGVFVVAFKGVMMRMCGHTLLKFSKLLITGAKEYKNLFAVLDKSKENIENILTSIEQKVQLK